MGTHKASKFEKKRILFVVANIIAQKLVGLTFAGYKIVIARDFNTGLRLARQQYFDLYVMENCLPEGTGVELCQHIREFDPHTPILFLSKADESDARKAVSAQLYITNPRFGEIEEGIKRLLNAASSSSHDARLAEIAAIKVDLVIHSKENSQHLDEAKERSKRAEEKAIRAKAKLAFLSAKGTRGDFARMWPSVYAKEVRDHRNYAKTLLNFEEFAAHEGCQAKNGVVYFGENAEAMNYFFIKATGAGFDVIKRASRSGCYSTDDELSSLKKHWIVRLEPS